VGWVIKTDQGKFKACYRDPERKIRSQTFERRQDAKRFLNDTEVKKTRGLYLDPALGRQLLSEYWPRFMDASANLRPSTRALYEGLARGYLLPYLGSRSLSSITQLDVQGCMNQSETPATRSAIFRLVRRVLNTAVDAGILGRNPCRGIKPPRAGTGEMKFLSATEVERLANAIEPRYRALVYVLSYGGLRIGEAVALRVENLDLLRGRVSIMGSATEVGGKLHFGPTKTRACRTITLPDSLRRIMEDHLENYASPGGYVFSAPEGGPLRPGNFRARYFAPSLEAAKLERVRVHDLRHTCASLLIAQGAHAKEIADRLGHSSPMVTMSVYAHILPSLEERLSSGLEETLKAARDEVAARQHEGSETEVPAIHVAL
jgi:integrase